MDKVLQNKLQVDVGGLKQREVRGRRQVKEVKETKGS